MGDKGFAEMAGAKARVEVIASDMDGNTDPAPWLQGKKVCPSDAAFR